MKKIATVLTRLVMVLWLGAVSCGQAGPAAGTAPAAGPPVASSRSTAEVQWDKTVVEAKKEGQVTVYTLIGPEARDALNTAFKQKYGINLEFVSGARGTELTQKLLTERRAGLYLGDVVSAGTSDLIPDMKPKGLLEPLDHYLVLPETLDPKGWRGDQIPFLDKEHTAVGTLTQYLRHMLRNTDMVKQGEITSYKDLLKSKWQGKAVLRDPTTTGNGNTWVTFLALKVWGLEPTKEFLRQFAATGPAVLRDTRLQVEWVARGKYPIGIATRMEDTADFLRMGAPVAWVSVAEGGLISAGSSSMGVINQPAHPNAAKVFVNWLLTREGQTAFSKGYGYPSARNDVPTEGIDSSNLPGLGEKFYLDDEDNILAKSKMLDVGKEIFGSLMQ